MRSIEVPGLGPIQFPDTMSDEQIVQAIERDILPGIQSRTQGLPAAPQEQAPQGGTTQAAQAEPVPERGLLGTVGARAMDVLGSGVSGAGSVFTGIGGLGGLTGITDYDNMLTRAGRGVSEFGAGLMSPELRNQRRVLAQAVEEAESRGLGAEAAAALQTLATNPGLLASMAIEQIPAFVLSGGVGRLFGIAGQVAARGGTRAAEVASRAGQAGAIGTAAGLQTGGISSETYREVMELPVETIQRSPVYQSLIQSMSPEEARAEIANRAAREAGVIGGGISVAAMTALPSAERALFSRNLSQRAINRALGVGTGEAISEGIEEGGGQAAQNIGIQRQADPERSLTRGVGGAAATGAVLGGVMGAGVGALQRPEAPPTDDRPELRRAIEEYVAGREPEAPALGLLPREPRTIETPVGNLSRSQLVRYMERRLPEMIRDNPGLASVFEYARTEDDRLRAFTDILEGEQRSLERGRRESDDRRFWEERAPFAEEAFDIAAARRGRAGPTVPDVRAGAPEPAQPRLVFDPVFDDKTGRLIGGEAITRIGATSPDGSAVVYVEREVDGRVTEVPVRASADQIYAIPMLTTPRMTQEAGQVRIGPEQVAGRRGIAVDPARQSLIPRRVTDRAVAGGGLPEVLGGQPTTPPPAPRPPAPAPRRAGLLPELDVPPPPVVPVTQANAETPTTQAETFNIPIGRQFTVATPDGSMNVDVVPELVDLFSLTPASGGLQNRMIDNPANQKTINNIANAPDFGRLGTSPYSDRGAPIIGPDNVIEIGNHRVEGLKRAAENNPAAFQTYIEALNRAGYDTTGIQFPVLIRRRVSDLTPEQRQNFTRLSNSEANQALSDLELAKQDASLLTPELLAKFDGEVSGGVRAAKNLPFVRDFLSQIATPSEMTRLISPEGGVSDALADRLERALFASAYNDISLIKRAVETGDDDTKSITSGMIEATGAMQELRRGIAEGRIRPEFDIVPSLVKAADRIRAAKANGLTPGDILTTEDMLNPIPALERELIKLLSNDSLTKIASKSAIGKRLKAYVEEAKTQTTDTDLVGGERRITPEEAVVIARNPGQASMFSARRTEAPAEEAEAAPEEQAPNTDKAREIIKGYLNELRAEGRQGRLIANGLEGLLKDRKLDANQIYQAFIAAKVLAKTLPGKANYRIRFLQDVIVDNAEAGRASGAVVGQRAQGRVIYPTASLPGVIELSLAQDMLPFLRETAAHEAFHVLQSYFSEYDKNFADRINRFFKDGMTVSDLEPSIKRRLQGLKVPGQNKSYYDLLADSLGDSPLSAKEAQAYAFGSLIDAANRGQRVTGLIPSFQRFFTAIRSFFSGVKRALSGDGFTSPADILTAAQRRGRGMEQAAPTIEGQALSARNTQEALTEAAEANLQYSQGLITAKERDARVATAGVRYSVIDRNNNTRVGSWPTSTRARAEAEKRNQQYGAQVFSVKPEVGGAESAFSARRAPYDETISVDGVERPILNSDGRRIHPTDEGTRNFWRWFDGSVVADEDGNPVMVYHGTSRDKDFDKFKVGQRGAWFTTNPKEASDYAEENDSGYKVVDYNPRTGYAKKDISARVIPVYLSIKNPAVLTDEQENKLRYAKNYAKAQSEIFTDLRAEGYDGVNIGGGVWVAFNPTQIKSSVGNVGSFSGADQRIQYSARKPLKPIYKTASETVSGPIVYQDPNVALIEAVDGRGEPVYIGVTEKGSRTLVDVTKYTGSMFTEEEKNTLLEARRKRIAQVKKIVSQNPDGPFRRGNVVFDSTFPENMRGFIEGILGELGLNNERIFFGTFNGAMEPDFNERNELYGKYYSVKGMGFFKEKNPSTYGLAKNTADGSYRAIMIDEKKRQSVQIETIAHEIGHIFDKVAYQNASPETKREIKKAFSDWLTESKKESAKEYIRLLRTPVVGKEMSRGVPEDISASQLSSYSLSFDEWFADQVARWALTSKPAESLIGKFFQRIAAAYRKIVNAMGRVGLPNQTVEKFIEEHRGRSIVQMPQPTAVKTDKPVQTSFDFSARRVPEYAARASQGPVTQAKSFFEAAKADLNKPNVFDRALSIFLDKKKGETIGQAFARTSINRAAPLWNLDMIAKEGGYTGRSAAKAMEMALQNTGRMAQLLTSGMGKIDAKTGVITLRKDVKPLLEIMKGANLKTERLKDEFQAYLAALRERDLRSRGRQGFFNTTAQQVNDWITSSEAAHPEWVQAAAELDKLNNALVDWAVETGIVSKAQSKTLRDVFYTPFYRLMDKDSINDPTRSISPKIGESFTNVASAINREMKGGTKPLGDLYENIIRNADSIMKAGLKNLAMKQAAETMEFAKLGQKTKTKDPDNTIVYKIDGQDVIFEVKDPALFAALAGMPRTMQNGIYNTMAKMAGVFRDFVTVAPSFMIANLWRGKISAYVQEGQPFMTNTIAGMRDALKASSSLQNFQLQTGFGGMEYGMGERDMAIALDRMMSDEGIRKALLKGNAWGAIRQAYGKMQALSEASEMAERIKLAENLMKRGMSKEDAEFQAYLLAPYSRRGTGQGWVGSSMQLLMPLVPFLNAKLQTTYRLFENEKKDKRRLWTLGIPQQMFLRGLVVTAFSLMAYLANLADDEEKWDSIPSYMKLNYDIIPFMGNYITLPRAFEIGQVFGALPIFAIDAIRRGEGRDLAAALAEVGLNTFWMNPTPQAIRPIFSVWTNYDFFRSRPLETMAEQNLPVSERVNRSTTSVGRGLSETVNMVFGKDTLSPIRAQALLDGYTGTLGVSLMAGFDSLLAAAGAIPGKPAGAFGELSGAANFIGVNRFYREDATMVSRFVGDFYKIKEMTDQIVRSYNLARETRNFERLEELRGEEGLPLRLRPLVNRASEQVSNLNKQISRIERSTTLDGVAKAEAMQPLIRRRDQIARSVVERARAIGAF